MKEAANGPENRIQQLKDKLDLDLDELSMPAPSMKLEEYIRVLRLARKPTREEFAMIAKVSIAGIGLIGMIGFLIYLLLTEIPTWLGR